VKKKQIVFINQSSGYLMIDIIHSYAEKYEERILMTGSLGERNCPLDKDVKVEWLRKYERESTFKRLITWFLAFIKALYLIKFKYRNAHLFLVSNPPFAPLIPLFCKNTFSLLIYDIYPDALFEFNIVKEESKVVKLWKKANISIFKRADKVYTITEQMKQRLEQYTPNDKISVVPIWTDNTFLKPIPKSENIFLKEHKIQDKFIVMYSGNLGKSHPVEVLVDIANECIDEKEIQFIIIGAGDKFEMIKKRIDSLSLSNIKLLPWQDTKLLPYTISSADIALVTLGNEAADLSIPSKTYNLMSVGVPILCIANKNSALSKLIESNSMGKTFSSDEKKEIIDFIKECKNNPEISNKLKKNSLKASLNYTPENAKLFN
jgi:glycosyltransferase involved in cell wall biosynthesis